MPVTFTTGTVMHERTRHRRAHPPEGGYKAAIKARVEEVAGGAATKFDLGVIAALLPAVE